MRAWRFILFILLVLVAQVILGYSLTSHTFPELDLLNKYLPEENTILYFGDSVITGGAGPERGNGTITEMLQDLVPSKHVRFMTHEAQEMKIYDAYITYIARSGYHPDAIIIPLNLRSFNPQWDKNPRYQFPREKFILNAPLPMLGEYFYRPLAIFHATGNDPISLEDYLALPEYYDGVKVGTVGEYLQLAYSRPRDKKSIEQYLSSEFVYPLNSDNAELVALAHLAKTAHESNLNVIVYVSPANYQLVAKYMPVLGASIKDGGRTACDIVKKENLPCLDLSVSIPDSYFQEAGDPYGDEHMEAKGRQFVAQSLYDAFFKQVPSGRLQNKANQRPL